ncbi:hypothetical protein JY651_11600 [Pyxidicoccus parkwayensis]|uniref:Chromosome partition protein Smc n=1 Tax=Pyxidicoccus parkwayensis TaxID=2813578 RepID=A0ABX7P534_9BACT|nr:flagellar export protein FliJ [Pyxidicoccus parkwaysis]QSQ25530.1 hypothetical protein JY651_11600 [Pyxidicoccus parkwaysis]
MASLAFENRNGLSVLPATAVAGLPQEVVLSGLRSAAQGWEGTAVGGLFDGLPVTVSQTDGVIRLGAVAPDGWLLSQAFPSLRSSPLAKLPFSEARLDVDGNGVAISGMLHAQNALPLEGDIRVTGRVSFGTEGPSFLLATAPVDSLELGPVRLSGVRLELMGVAEGVARLVGVARLGGRDFQLEARLGDPRGALRFGVAVADGDVLSLADVAGWLDGLSVPELPEELGSAADSFGLERLVFTVDPVGSPKLRAFSISLRTGKRWELFGSGERSFAVESVVVTVGVVLAPLRQVSVRMTGQMSLGTALLEASVGWPDFQVSAGLALESTLDVREALAVFADLPEDAVPETTLKALRLDLAPRNRRFSVEVEAAGSWKVDLGELTTLTVEGASLLLDVGPDETLLAVAGTVRVADVYCELFGQLADSVLTFGLKIPSISLSGLMGLLLGDAELPPEVSDVMLSDVALTVTPAHKAFVADVTVSGSWPIGVGDAAAGRLVVHVAGGKGVDGVFRSTGRLELSGEGPFPVVDGFQVDRIGIVLEKAATGWTVGGTLGATVFDHALTLAVSTSTATPGTTTATPDTTAQPQGAQTATGPQATSTPAAATRTTRFEVLLKDPLSAQLGDASLSLSRVALEVVRGATQGGKLTVAGRLSLLPLLDLGGTLIFEDGPTKTGFQFRPEGTSLRLPLPIPGSTPEPELVLTLAELAVAREQGRWTARLNTTGDVHSLPASVQQRLPLPVRVRLEVGPTSFVEVRPLLPAQTLPLPTIEVAGARVSLGSLGLEIAALRVELATSWTVGAELGLGLPPELNNMFGQCDGQPRVRFFRTWTPDAPPQSMVRARIDLDTAQGLRVQLLTSPLQAMTFTQVGTQTWCTLDMGDFGAARLLVPAIAYDGASFLAQGGWEQLRPLSLPMEPLKSLLSACGMEALADSFPDAVPLREVKLLDAQGRLRTDALERFLSDAGVPVPDEVRKALDVVAERFEHLPDTFKRYLDIVVPDRFRFDFGATPDGSARIRVETTGAPLRLLLPMAGPLGPRLMGVELRKLVFGELMSGTLAVLQIDATFDTFDLLTLAAVLLLPLESLPLMKDPRGLRNQVVLDDLLMVILYQAGVPVPVPVFFDEVALRYQGLEGLSLETSFRFPTPALSPSAAMSLFRQFESFFTQRDALLDPDAVPADADLAFTIGPNWFQLPPYLGGATLGTKDGLAPLRVWPSMARLLNWAKTLDMEQLVAAIPREVRVGSVDVRFVGLGIAVHWAVTTLTELRGQPDLLPGGRVISMDGLVPEGAKGVVAVLGGSVGIGQKLMLAADFGLMGSTQGMETGFRFEGNLADGLLALSMNGRVAITPEQEPAFAVQGALALTADGSPVLTGSVSATDSRFELEAMLDLLPGVPQLQVGGQVRGHLDSDSFLLQGTARVTVAGWDALGALSTTVSSDGALLQGTLLGQTLQLALARPSRVPDLPPGFEQSKLVLSARLDGGLQLPGFSLGNSARVVVGGDASGRPRLVVGARVSLLDLADARAVVELSAAGFAFRAEGRVFELFQARVDASGASLTSVKDFQVAVDLSLGDFFTVLAKACADAIRDAASVAAAAVRAGGTTLDAARGTLTAAEGTLTGAQKVLDAAKEALRLATRTMDAAKAGLSTARGALAAAEKAVEVAAQAVEAAKSSLSVAQGGLGAAQKSVKVAEDALDVANDAAKAANKAKNSFLDAIGDVAKYLLPEKDRKKLDRLIDDAKRKSDLADAAKRDLAAAMGKLSVVQQQIATAERDISKWGAEFDRASKAVLSQTEAVRQAEAQVTQASADVERAQRDVDSKQQDVDAAKRALDGAKKKVRDVQDQVVQAQRRADRLADLIRRDAGTVPLVKVESASFRGQLDTVSGGRVSLAVRLGVLGDKPQSLQVSYDFHNPSEDVKALVERLLGLPPLPLFS